MTEHSKNMGEIEQLREENRWLTAKVAQNALDSMMRVDPDEDRKKLVEQIHRYADYISWLWENCTIIHYPNGTDPMKGGYPVEHCILNGRNKDNRRKIEQYMEDQA